MIRKFYTYSQVLSEFRDQLSQKDLDYLKTLDDTFNSGGTSTVSATLLASYFGGEMDFRNDGSFDGRNVMQPDGTFVVDKLYFKAFRRIALLTYIDVLGEEQVIEVEADYELEEEYGDIKLEYEYIPTVYVMHSIGEIKTAVYIAPTELEVQRTDINNIADCKLPITGKHELMVGLPNHSIPLTVDIYQKTVNILHLARERAIAKNHGKVAIFPKGMMGSDDTSQEETLYYMSAAGIMMPDESIPNFAVAIQGLKHIDLSDAQYIQNLSNLIAETKQLANDAVDMNRQRAGETYASDGKFTTEQAIIRSSLGTAIINETFNHSRARDYDCDIDFTKIAWIEGKKSKYITSDRKAKFFEINGTEHSERSYGTIVDNSAKSNEELMRLKDIAFNMSQNGQTMPAVEAIHNDNVAKLREVILKYEHEKELAEKNARDQEARNAKLNSDAITKAEETKQTREDARLQKEIDKDIKIALINARARQADNNNGRGVEKIENVDDLNNQIASLKEQLNMATSN